MTQEEGEEVPRENRASFRQRDSECLDDDWQWTDHFQLTRLAKGIGCGSCSAFPVNIYSRIAR
jgi:hypothetical protein